jgi:thiol-disulfide isomerase/thioredoxin
MKKSKTGILTFALMLSYGFTQAQGITFKTGDWAAIQRKAEDAGKLIFVDVYTTWCKPCKKMDKYVFSNKKVGDYFNTHFISYKLDAEKGAGLAFSKKYEVISYPNLMFLDHDGMLVLRSGSKNIEELLAFGEKAMNYEQDMANMTSTYNKGNRTPEFINKYLAFLKASGKPTNEIAIQYLKKIDKDQWFSDNNLNLMFRYIDNPYNTIIEYLVQSKAAYVGTLIGDYSIPLIIKGVYVKHLNKLISEEKGAKDIEKCLVHASLRLEAKEMAYCNFIAKREVAIRDEDWTSYVKHTVDYVNAYEMDRPYSLNNYAYAFYKNKNITDPKALNEALRWVNAALEKKMLYAFLDTKVALLYKLGRKEEALTVANKALEFAEKSGQKGSSILKHVEKIKAL